MADKKPAYEVVLNELKIRYKIIFSRNLQDDVPNADLNPLYVCRNILTKVIIPSNKLARVIGTLEKMLQTLKKKELSEEALAPLNFTINNLKKDL